MTLMPLNFVSLVYGTSKQIIIINQNVFFWASTIINNLALIQLAFHILRIL